MEISLSDIKTYCVKDIDKLDSYIKKLNSLKNSLTEFKVPMVDSTRCMGKMKDETDKVANDLVKMRGLYVTLINRTVCCLSTFRNSVDSNDREASREVQR